MHNLYCLSDEEVEQFFVLIAICLRLILVVFGDLVNGFLYLCEFRRLIEDDEDCNELRLVFDEEE